MAESDSNRLKREVERRVSRMNRRDGRRRTLLAQFGDLGVLGMLVAIPIVGGVYIGRWIDERIAGYSVGWTLGCMVLGVAIGFVNVYLYMRR
jgi:ATP synthase protein I